MLFHGTNVLFNKIIIKQTWIENQLNKIKGKKI